MVQDLTYVTSFYKIYGTEDETYLVNFIRFAEKGAPIILYLDNQCKAWGDRLAPYTNVQVLYDTQFDDLPVAKLFPKEQTTLPTSANPAKDTYEYMVLMNSKLEWMMRAAPLAKTTNIAWIDFGIVKILKNLDAAVSKLNNVQIPADKVLIPGCYDTPTFPLSMDNVHWRFCGGLIFGSKQTISRFYDLSTKRLTDLAAANPPKLSWEVNVWAYIERDTPDVFQWYKADHNDSIVNFPVPKKVMVILMIKNESAIIERCI